MTMRFIRTLLEFYVLILITEFCGAQECGYFKKVKSTDSGIIKTPNYPNKYSIMDKCIWVYEAPQNYSVKFTFSPIKTPAPVGGECHDYVEVRDGFKGAKLIKKMCATSTSQTVISTGRYAWVKFVSDYQYVNTGFTATWKVTETGVKTTKNALQNCSSGVYFTCRNRECVEYGYICDSFNDCGCIGKGCDEYNCDLLFHITKLEYYGLCVGSGIGLFIVIFFSCLCIEREDYRPRICRKHDTYDTKGPTSTCCACLASCRKDMADEKDPYQQMLAMIQENRHPLATSWYSTSESESRSASQVSPSPRPSLVPTDAGSRRSSLHPPPPSVVYGNTLRPNDVPVQRRGSSIASTPRASQNVGAAKGNTLTTPRQVSNSGKPMSVPAVTIQESED